MNNEKYYFVKRKGDQAYPLISITNMGNVQRGEDDILECHIDPVVRKSVMADYLRSTKDIFSKRVADVMQAMNMEGVHFYPTEVDDTKGTVYDGYVCVVVDGNTYKLLDLENSDYDVDDEIDKDNPICQVRKIVIDREKLNEIPLNKRLGMRLREYPGRYLYHQSVVDAVMALEPTGMYFQDIEDAIR
jgi:hypothetical protein